MRPTIVEERAHAIVGELDEWQLPPEERRALESRLATPWRRNRPYVALAFFVLTALGVGALTAFCDEIGVTEFVAAALAIALAEYLIGAKRMFGTGVESALWIGGLLAFIFGLPSSGKPEALLVFAAAFVLAGWRMQNALFATIAMVLVVGYWSVRLDHANSYWLSALLPLAFLAVAIVMKGRTVRRPWVDSTWSLVAIVMPLAAHIAGYFAAETNSHIGVALGYVVLGGICVGAGLRLREHSLLIASGVCLAVAAYELHDLFDYPLEWKLILGGLALLGCAGALSRSLRGRTQGLVATPARLTRYDDLVQLGATTVAASAVHDRPPDADPGMEGDSGGRGSFGGAGATGDY